MAPVSERLRRGPIGVRNLELAVALGFRSASAVTTACRRARAGARTAKARRGLEELVAHAAGELWAQFKTCP